MQTKRAYTLEDVIGYLESLEMLNMTYTVQKYSTYYDLGTSRPLHNVWIIEYEAGAQFPQPETAIEFED